MKFTKFLSAALALTLVCGATFGRIAQPENMTTADAAYKDLSQGECGKNMKWKYEDEVLTITGDGELTGSIWTSLYQWSIRKVVINGEVTSICSKAFEGCEYLNTINLPDSVTEIGSYAFYLCQRGLTTIKLPKNLKGIETGTFMDCKRLSSITIPDSVTYIEKDAFWDCDSLTEIEIPASVARIGGSAFGECLKLESITIYNPKCKIATGNNTVCNVKNDQEVSYSGVIKGYKGSTAEAYAEKNGYKFEALEGEPPQIISFGDPNGDGLIDASDASFVLAEYAKISTGGTSELTVDVKTASDANSDGSVDASDASLMLGFYAHVSTGGELDFPTYIKGGIA